MTIPRTSLFSAFALTVVLLVGFALLYWLPDDNIERDLRDQIRIQALAGDITHLDEVLTMSARMAAATGDPQWENRYLQFEPQLDQAIGEAMKLARSAIMEEASAATFDANETLVKMEHEVFDLVRSGDLAAASAVINSETYETQKKIYADSLTRIGARMNEEMAETLANQRQHDLQVVGVFASALILAAIFWASLVFHKPIERSQTP